MVQKEVAGWRWWPAVSLVLYLAKLCIWCFPGNLVPMSYNATSVFHKCLSTEFLNSWHGNLASGVSKNRFEISANLGLTNPSLILLFRNQTVVLLCHFVVLKGSLSQVLLLRICTNNPFQRRGKHLPLILIWKLNMESLVWILSITVNKMDIFSLKTNSVFRTLKSGNCLDVSDPQHVFLYSLFIAMLYKVDSTVFS